VAAAASVPSSFTSMKVWWITREIDSPPIARIDPAEIGIVAKRHSQSQVDQRIIERGPCTRI
jgi:hypothetical protein